MKYKLKLNHHHEFKIFEINKMAPRCYFIPHSTREGMQNTTLFNERKLSDKVMFLNGEWNFKYYSKCNDMPNEFDTATEKFDIVNVPCDWQRTGYEKPNYLNTRYQFYTNPPVIPKNIPCAVYVKNVDITEMDKTYLINFMGVCACFDLFVNGKFVGYSEGSHNTAEFDITQYLAEGNNEILAVVYKWCNGSYLECQDMFRENGIFRDVFIIKEDAVYLQDFGYDTAYNEDGTYDFTFDYTMSGDIANLEVKFELVDKDGKVILTDSFANTTDKKTYPALNVAEWTAETPNLYDLIVSVYVNGELRTITHKNAGFKHIEIKGNVFYFNNKKIKLFGVNHHESHPKNGFVMTVEELEKDIQLLKDYNANCVRLSHYPHDPLFITLCDIYGLYTVDEMDIECHGIYQNNNLLDRRFGRISENLEWKGHFLDRAHRMFYRDRCHASITLWSLGNEAGGDKCHQEAYKFFQSVTKTPVQYEGCWHTKQFSYDVIGEFYPSRAKLESYANKTHKNKKMYEKPYFMTEYSHAMGVGPGGLNDTVKLVLANDNFLGGCIWEFCDHTAQDIHEKYKYTYGGDFNEKQHDGNFCVDGLFFPWREPSTGALNMRECYRPIRCEQKENGKYVFTSTRYFADSSDIDINYTVLRNGEKTTTGKLDIVVPAEGSVETDILLPIPRDLSEYTLQIVYTQNDKYVASEDFAVTPHYDIVPKMTKPEYTEANGNINITFDNGEIQISKSTGEIISYKLAGKELINQAPRLGEKALRPNMTRMTIDNDRFIKIGWMFLGTLNAQAKHKNTAVESTDDTLKVINTYSINGFGKLATFTVTMTIDKSGAILVDVFAKRALKLAITGYSDIVRCGVTLEMNREFDNVKYYGLGDKETLSDFDDHGMLGIYSLKVDDMHEPYIKPQESGNRSKVRWATLTNDDGYGLRVDMTDKLLNINANHYTFADVKNVTHMEELEEAKQDTTCLQVDGFMRGTGSQSCGPQPTPEHRPNLKTPLSYSFVLSPVVPEKE